MAEKCEFPQTEWSLVETAGEEAAGNGRPVLAELLKRYSAALRAHLGSHFRITDQRIDDLLQGFIASRVLETHLIAKADRFRGKFRTFLLTSLDNYVSSELRAERAQCRGGNGTRSLESENEPEPSDRGYSPNGVFDVAWARGVIAEAIERLHAQCEASGRLELWELLDKRVLGPALTGAAPVSYAQLVERFGFATPSQACNALVTAKRMFARILREIAAEYTDDPAEVDAEIRDLRAILANARA
jgi:DNA-directed RNA polymerase specialized sigma24 family protein